jgi:uncharacterized protein YecA (UPF0149 family)
MTPSEALPGPAGPRTEIGKSIASRNASKNEAATQTTAYPHIRPNVDIASGQNGLFAAHDFIRENETEEYAESHADLYAELSPEGYLEETFTAEIMTATWRLRRCRIVEAGLAIDSLADDFTSPEQKSVDRARAQSHTILRRCLAELRKLQTERAIRPQLPGQSLPALAGLKQVDTALRIHDRQRLLARKADGLDTLEGLIAQADKNLCMDIQASKEPPSSFCKNVPEPLRNAPCPCNSGMKYKQCCARTGAGWPALAA